MGLVGEDGYIQVLTTVGNERDAERVARIIVNRKLAACAQIVGPIKSYYWWRGNVETSKEWICIFKTRKGLYEKLEKAIREVHNYELPEIVALPIVSGSKSYLEWISREVEG